MKNLQAINNLIILYAHDPYQSIPYYIYLLAILFPLTLKPLLI